jgi:transcriptional regulator of acetoin/glycerol metabolism
VLELDPALSGSLRGRSATSRTEPPLSLDRGESLQIRKALKAAGGNRARAARMLGISRATIYRKIKEYGLQ